MSPWNDKVAVVTGGSAGLGLKLAGEFVRQGSSVVLAARNEARLREACGSINAPSGSRVLPCPTDITDQSQVDVLVAKTQEEFGHVDVLVNCAGKSSRGEVLETKPDEFQDLLNLNFSVASTLHPRIHAAITFVERTCRKHWLASVEVRISLSRGLSGQ